MKKDSPNKIIASNRKAYKDYVILEKMECGIELAGTEVKSLRQARVSLADSFARCEDGEIFLYKLQILAYDPASRFNHDPIRKRKLLLKKRQIIKLSQETNVKGHALIPLQLYFKDQWVKVELGLAKGKKLYDKREDIKKRSVEREIQQASKQKRTAANW